MDMAEHTPKLAADLQRLLEISERKADILTNLLREAGAEYEQTLKKIRVSEANFRAILFIMHPPLLELHLNDGEDDQDDKEKKGLSRTVPRLLPLKSIIIEV